MRRNSTLDLLRAIAVIVIIFHHLYLPDQNTLAAIPGKAYNVFISFINIWHTGGWIAVDMFFVLSGFLVSGLLFNEYKKYKHIDVKSFIARRGFKIYPAFVFFIVSTFIFELVVSKAMHKQAPSIIESLKDLAFLHNYLAGRWIHTWSLDIEEFFYLTIPFFLFVLIKYGKLKLSSLFSTYLVLVLLGLTCRWININHAVKYDFNEQFIKTHFRLDGLFLGVVISYIYNFKPNLLNTLYKYKILALLISTSILVLNFVFERESNLWISVVMLAVNPPAFAVLITLALKFLPDTGNKWLLKIGQCSYSIYLWHLFFNYYYTLIYLKAINQEGLAQHQQIVYIVYVTANVLSSLGFGILMTRLIENPSLKWRDKYYPPRVRNIITNVNQTPEIINLSLTA